MRLGAVWISTVALGVVWVGRSAPAFSADPAPITPASAVSEPVAEEASAPAPAARRARPALPTAAPIEPLPWARHIELGAAFAVVSRPSHLDDARQRTPIRLRPAPGWGINLTWRVLRYLHFGGYFIGAAHALSLPVGSLGQPGTITASRAVTTYVFGARIMPSYPITDRVRVSLSAGAGWGRVSYPRLEVTEAGQRPFTIRERNTYLAELPIGFGATFEVIPRWLNVDLGFTGAFLLSQQGEALEPTQAVDYAGKKRAIGTMSRFDASFVQTLGLSLIL